MLKDINTYAQPDSLRLAQEIVESDAVIGTYAACEWNELDENGQLWISAIIQEAHRRFSAPVQPRNRCTGNLRAAPFMMTPSLISRMLAASARPAPAAAVDLNEVSPEPADLQPKGEAEGHSEPARVAPLQAAPSALVEASRLGQPDTNVQYWKIHYAMMERGSKALCAAIEEARGNA